MKIKMIWSMVLILFVALPKSSHPQIRKGLHEISISGSYGSIKYDGDKEFTNFLNLPIRYGFYPAKQISIEPELIYTKIEEIDPGYVASFNLALNFSQLSVETKAVPFLLVGAGFSNAQPVFQHFTPGKDGRDVTFKIINVGAGLKLFLSKSVALRLEYRFQKFNAGEKEIGFDDWRYTEKIGSTMHHVYWGISAFF